MKMSDNNDDVKPGATPEEIQAQVSAQVAEQLKDIKLKLDQAYAARDEAVRTRTQLEEQTRQKEMEALTAAGKHQEVSQMKLAAAEEKIAMMTKQLTAYQRDSVVQEQLRSLTFRNDKSAQMAYRDITDQLVQNDEGEWVHKTGVKIKDYVASFAKDPENEFLFAPKANGGGGSGSGGNPAPTKKKISEMTTAEALAAAAAGQLGTMTF
jgi:hypothetical protein